MRKACSFDTLRRAFLGHPFVGAPNPHSTLLYDRAWVYAELHAELKKRSVLSGWVPFSKEVPYVTFYPVQLPKKAYRDWRVDGAVK